MIILVSMNIATSSILWRKHNHWQNHYKMWLWLGENIRWRATSPHPHANQYHHHSKVITLVISLRLCVQIHKTTAKQFWSNLLAECHHCSLPWHSRSHGLAVSLMTSTPTNSGTKNLRTPARRRRSCCLHLSHQLCAVSIAKVLTRIGVWQHSWGQKQPPRRLEEHCKHSSSSVDATG